MDEQPHFVSKLIGFVSLAFGNTGCEGLVETVSFVFIVTLLHDNLAAQLQVILVFAENRFIQFAFKLANQPPGNSTQFLAGFFRLFRPTRMLGVVAIAQQLLAYAHVRLALVYMFGFRNPVASVDEVLNQFLVGRKGGVISLNRRVREGLLALFASRMHPDRIGKDPLNPFLVYPFSKMGKITWITAKLTGKMGFSAKILHVEILLPSLCQSLIAIIIEMFQQQTTDHKTNGQRRLAGLRIQIFKSGLKIGPVDGIG
jgi:hypothetical protein